MTNEVSTLNNKFFSNSQIELLKNTLCKGITDDEFNLFQQVCLHTGLDPFSKQIYPVKRYSKKLNREEMSIQTGVDGYRLIADRTGRYCPGREPTFSYDKEGRLVSATAYVKKQTKDGTWHEVSATAFFHEYVQTNKENVPTQFWMKMGHTMTAKCAEVLAIRKAFPGEFSNLRAEEEMQQSYFEEDKRKSTVESPSIRQEKQREFETIELEDIKAQVDNIEKKANQIIETITNEQARELFEMLKTEPKKLDAILFHEKIERLEQLPKENFEKAIQFACGQ
jgi:phage recombination protein Bet